MLKEFLGGCHGLGVLKLVGCTVELFFYFLLNCENEPNKTTSQYAKKIKKD